MKTNGNGMDQDVTFANMRYAPNESSTIDLPKIPWTAYNWILKR